MTSDYENEKRIQSALESVLDDALSSSPQALEALARSFQSGGSLRPLPPEIRSRLAEVLDADPLRR
jgi:hypothetical protein